MNYAVIDLGSNTVRLCVYDVSPDGRYKTIVNRKIMASLAAYVDSGRMSDEGIAEAVDSVRKCLKRASYLNPARVDVFATAVLRNAVNGDAAARAIEEACGCEITLLSEADEAHLGFVGASSKDALDNGVLVDIGGGSSEVTLVAAGTDAMRASLPIGSLSSYRAHVADILPVSDEMAGIRADVGSLLEGHAAGMAEHRVRKLFGVGGSIRALAEVNAIMTPEASARELSREDACRLESDLMHRRRAFIDGVLAAAPERIHTIACGLAILLELFERFDARTLHVCENGVREGYLIERMLKKK